MLKGNGRSDPIRVVVVDDSPTARDLLMAILGGAEGIQVVGAGALPATRGPQGHRTGDDGRQHAH